MPSHKRGKSRGSLSVLSFDTIRSFSRAGSRQSVTSPPPQDLGRSPSSLSYCDPYNQPPPVSIGTPLRSNQEQTASSENADEQKPQRKSRPLSWLPFGRGLPSNSRSVSDRFRMLKDSSSTSLAKSTISAPVLTGTRNVKIAQSEGVHCGELTPEIFDKSTWDGKIGWIRTEDDHAATQARQIAEQVAAEDQTPTTDKHARKLSQTVKDRFRGQRRRQAQSSVSTLWLDEEAEHGYGQKLARYKAETVNLCRDKIRSITGISSHSRSQSTSRLANNTTPPGARETSDNAERSGNENSPLIQQTTHNDSASLQLPHNHETSSQFESLTRSLNSILDKGLDRETAAMDYFRMDKYYNPSKASTPEKKEKNNDDEIKFMTIPDPDLPSDTEAETVKERQNGLKMHGDVNSFATAPPGTILPRPSLPYPAQLETTGEYAKTTDQTAKMDMGILNGEQLKEEPGNVMLSKEGMGLRLQKSMSRTFDKVKRFVRMENVPPAVARVPPTPSSQGSEYKRFGVVGLPKD